MATVEQQIAVRIKNFVEGLPQVQALSAAVQSLSRANGGSGLKTTAAQVVNLGTVSTSTLKNVSSLYTGFQNVSKGFANGSTQIKNFTGDLGVAAREMKVITDQSRLLGAAGSIQLPARNPVFETLKPLVEGEAVVEKTVNSLRTEAETVGRVATNAERLAEAWLAGNAAVKKQVESLAALNAETNAAFKNILSGNKPGSATGVGGGGGTPPKKPIQDLNEEVDKTPGKVSKASSAVSGFFRSLGRIVIISALFAAFYAIVNSIKDAINGVIDAIRAFTQEGIRYNAVLETSKISLASLIATTSDIRDNNGQLLTGADAFHAALSIAGKEMSKIQAVAIQTRFEFEDILQAVTLATAAVGGTNVTLAQTVSLTADLARAAAAIRLNPSQFQTQVRQILTGATRVQTVLATALFPGQSATGINKQIKEWREAGTLVENLTKRLQVFHITAAEVERTFDSLASNVVDAFKVFAGKSTLPLFEKVKDILDFILRQIIVFDQEGVRLTPTFQKVADILGVIGDEVGTRILAFIKDVAKQFGTWIDAVKASPERFRDIADEVVDIASTIGGMITDFLRLIATLVSFGDGVNGADTQLKAMSFTLATIRDFLRTIFGFVEIISAVFKTGILIGSALFAESLLIATGRLDRIVDLIRIAANEIKKLFIPGIQDIVAGTTGQDFPKSGLRPGLKGEADLGSFTASPRKVADDEKAAGERAKRERNNVLKQLNEAATALFLAQAKNEIDIQNQTNEEIIKSWQRRYDQGLASAKEFYDKKEQLTLENIQREENYKNQELEAEKEKLRLNLAALEGQADISDDHFKALLDRFKNAGDRSQINPKDVLFNKQIVEFLKFQKEGANIQGEINKLAEQRKEIQTDTNSAIEDSVRLDRQLGEELKGQLADALGATGVSDQLNIKKRISDELPRLLSEFDSAIPGTKEVANTVKQLATTDLSSVLGAFDLFNVDVDKLSESTRTFLNLIKQLVVGNDLARSAAIVSDTVDKLKFDLEGVQTGFDKGDIGLSNAVAAAQEFKRQAVENLSAEYLKQKQILDALPPAVTPAEVANVDRKTRAVAALGRQIEALGNGTDELALITADSTKANDLYSNKLDEINIKRQNYSISAVEATREEIAAKRELITALEEELAKARELNQAVPENAQRVAGLINQIATLRNEVNGQTLDVAHGIENAVGGAISNFYDAITQGNESMLTSFRRAIAGMLVEIGKLIFQAYALKAIMSALDSFIGGFLGGGGGSGSGSFSSGTFGPFGGPGSGLAEGGIVSGPGTGVSDSIPAMLSHGEAVIPARSVSTYGRGLIQSLISGSFIPMRGFQRFAEGGFAGGSSGSASSAGGRGTRIVNLVDKSLVSDYLNSSEGEDIILNIIGRNPGVLQRLA